MGQREGQRTFSRALCVDVCARHVYTYVRVYTFTRLLRVCVCGGDVIICCVYVRGGRAAVSVSTVCTCTQKRFSGLHGVSTHVRLLRACVIVCVRGCVFNLHPHRVVLRRSPHHQHKEMAKDIKLTRCVLCGQTSSTENKHTHKSTV